MKFGQEVRRRRKGLGLTIEELAERAGLTPNYVGTVEIGDRDPSLSTIRALARALATSPGELLGGTERLSPQSLEAARLFEGAASELQEIVLRLLKAVQRRKR